MYRTRPVLLAMLAGLTAEAAGPDAGKIDRLICQLGSDNFREREAASKRLEEIGQPALGALRKAARSDDPEVRRRAAGVVEAVVSREDSRARGPLQGLWVLKTTEYLGERANQDPTDEAEIHRLGCLRSEVAEERELTEDLRKHRTTLEFKGWTFEYRRWDVGRCGAPSHTASTQGTYHLDVHRKPKVLKKVWVDPLFVEPQIRYGIYSVEGDTLQVCIHFNQELKDLPTTFKTDKDEDVVLLTFKRERSRAGGAAGSRGFEGDER
jgi:hypothetical protein